MANCVDLLLAARGLRLLVALLLGCFHNWCGFLTSTSDTVSSPNRSATEQKPPSVQTSHQLQRAIRLQPGRGNSILFLAQHCKYCAAGVCTAQLIVIFSQVLIYPTQNYQFPIQSQNGCIAAIGCNCPQVRNSVKYRYGLEFLVSLYNLCQRSNLPSRC